MTETLEEIPTPAPPQHDWMPLIGNEVACRGCGALVVRANDLRLQLPCPGA